MFTGQRIDDTITTSCSSAVGSAVGVGGVAVGSTIITFFTRLNDTITTLRVASGIASVSGSVQRSIITVFVEVSNAISTEVQRAVSTALRWVNTKVRSIITSFSSIGLVITANWESAVGSASVGCKGVVKSVITLFKTVSEVNFTITAFEQADGRASVEVVSVSVIALLSWVDDTITAGGQPAVSSANARDVSVSGSEIALLSVVDDAITASCQSAVGSAAVGLSVRERGITVSGSVIALLINTDSSGDCFESGVVFESSVSTLAVRELREIVDQLLQELIGDRGTSRSLENDGNNKGSSASSSVVVQLQFKVESSATDQMFGGGVEDESLQNILLTLVGEGLRSV